MCVYLYTCIPFVAKKKKCSVFGFFGDRLFGVTVFAFVFVKSTASTHSAYCLHRFNFSLKSSFIFNVRKKHFKYTSFPIHVGRLSLSLPHTTGPTTTTKNSTSNKQNSFCIERSIVLEQIVEQFGFDLTALIIANILVIDNFTLTTRHTHN